MAKSTLELATTHDRQLLTLTGGLCFAVSFALFYAFSTALAASMFAAALTTMLTLAIVGAILIRRMRARNRRMGDALDNMTQALCMFDRHERLLVCNKRYRDLYKLSAEIAAPGRSLTSLLAYRIANGTFKLDPDEYRKKVTASISNGVPTHAEVLSTDGRTLSIINTPTGDGGWVATHEDITERHRAEALIAHMARHDGLTGLINRVEFEQKMSEALNRLSRHGEAFALLMFDLDNFKPVNDKLGHPPAMRC
jgi:predicted signal transduction protein with EAL and GGDEF domain